MSLICCSIGILLAQGVAALSDAASLICASMSWMIVCSLYRLVFAESFTFRVLALRAVIWGVRGLPRSGLLRTRLRRREAGCTGPGTWRAGAGMEFWSLSGVRMRR